MRNVLILLKVIFKNRNKNNKFYLQLSKIEIIIMYLLVMISILALAIIFEISMYKDLKDLGLQDNLPYISILISTFLIVIISTVNIFTEFYYSNYLTNFLILPVKNVEILIAKFISISISPYLVSFYIFLTTNLIYGFINKASISYFLLAILGAITLPICVMVPMAILSMIFMYIFSRGILYNFQKLCYLISLLSGIIIALLIKFIDFRVLLSNLTAQKANIFFIIFPNNYFLAEGLLSDSNLKRYECIIYILGICFIYSIIIYFVTLNLYTNVLTKISEVNMKKHKNNIKSHNQLTSMIINDLKMILRNPFFFTNIVIRTFIIPISLFLLVFIRKDSSRILDYVNSNSIYIYRILLITIFAESKLNLVSATSISRDKDIYYIRKIIPVKYIYQIISKVLLGFMINIVPITLTLFIFKVAFSIPFIDILKIYVVSIVLCLSGSISGFIRNLKIPMLDYADNRSLISSNPNIIYIFLNTIFQCGILAWLLFYFDLTLKSSLFFLLITVFIVNFYIVKRRRVYVNMYKNL